LFYSSVAGVTVSSAGAVSVTAEPLPSCYFSRPPEFSVASVCQPLSESPSTIAAVTKDKILSIDLEASSFDGITLYFTRIRVSINHCKNWNV
jgi:hypothetical protein